MDRAAILFAVSRVPLAEFTAVGFTRPLVTIGLAAVLLGESIGWRRWLAAVVALAVNPGAVEWNAGLAAMPVVLVSGSGAIIATRRLRS